MTNQNRERDVRELNTRAIDDVAGGLPLHVGKGPPFLFLFPHSTGPTIPLEPKPVAVYV